MWKYALIGGLTSVPLTFGLYWLSGMGSEFSMNMVFFGGVLAGYLAKRNSAQARSAGIRAGVIGGLPIVVWALATLLGISDGSMMVWSAPLPEAVFLIFVGLVLLGISAIAGVLGGILGGWLSKKIGPRRTPGIGS